MSKVITEIKLPEELSNAIETAVTQVIAQTSKRALNNQYHVYLSKREAAEYLGISLNTLDFWIANSNIPFKKIGRTYRINRYELDKFMSSDTRFASS